MHVYILTLLNFIFSKTWQERQKRKCFFPFKAGTYKVKELILHVLVSQSHIFTYVKIRMKRKLYGAGADPEILKRGGALCWPPWLADEEKFRFQMV